MTGKNLEQWKHIKFCVKIDKSASETLALLTLACGEYAKKSVFLNGKGGSRKGEKMCRMTQEVGSQKRKGQMQMSTETLVFSDRRLGVRLIAEKLNMGICSQERTQTLA
jgi:hypothetical protein